MSKKILLLIFSVFMIIILYPMDGVGAIGSNPSEYENTDLLTVDNLSKISGIDQSISLPTTQKIKAIENFLKDPIANSIAVITLLFMIISGFGVFIAFSKEEKNWIDRLPGWLVPVLALVGLFVSFYLSFIELSNSEPVCGPVGDCSAVQQSKYAFLFGVIPIGILGILGYLTILLGWLLSIKGPEKFRRWANLIIWIMAWFGLFFSIYLTFLEPFVIGATCAWCITSAIIMTLLLWSSTGKAKEFWSFDDEE